ncbi:hypothetical protein DPX16_8250 [Anabarilius grahami]|uniref:Uncharacterized protein n=1 Tax=Anabarilius grahami TaxID=495550 RepID=A0A3N0Y8R6_ANAGA|nr:hypothetical protein DPX16_8250 [Anabarilius grahami]
MTRPQRSPEVSAEIESTIIHREGLIDTTASSTVPQQTVHTGVMNTILNWMKLK